MNKLRQKLVNILLVLSLLFSSGAIFIPVTVAAQATGKAAVCEGVALTGVDCGTEAPGTGVMGIIRTVISLLSLAVGVIAVIMIIIGGLKYVTSSGDSGNVTSAKNTILFAIVGLIIAALAQVIVRFVLDKVKT